MTNLEYKIDKSAGWNLNSKQWQKVKNQADFIDQLPGFLYYKVNTIGCWSNQADFMDQLPSMTFCLRQQQ
jgi:hypothetical protein